MWLERIDKTQNHAIKNRTVVGVVGNTGAGKSSVINALLDEERLVPTNCMRACTAVITEISFNLEPIPYRATVEFVDPADWERELRILFDELLDGSGRISRESTNEDSEAGIAYAKIKAVYPKLTKEMIEESSVETLMRHENVRVLGNTINLAEQTNLVFYRKLQGIIDSKEKSQGEDKTKGKEPAYWPLIKTVKLYVKAPALETGAVIVDLPGVHDSNAARAKVAENYMKSCTGLWIVAPINRAVDDKAAKTLLGETFKRQLKMDGGFSLVSFICSKTDDISVMEAADSLGLEGEFEVYDAQLSEHARVIEKYETEVKDFMKTKRDITNAAEEIIDKIEVWQTRKDDIEDGKSVLAPTGSKRKASGSPSATASKRRRVDSDDEASDGEDHGEVSNEEQDGDEDERGQDTRTALTIEQVNEELVRLKTARRASKDQKAEIDEKVSGLKTSIKELKSKVDAINTKKRAKCIKGRNKYSEGAIKADYASGIRELDQEIAEAEDAENFNPEEEKRDYDEVGRNLPVFCVSSRAYHKLQGRFRQEANVPGFEGLEETGIPQLQQHCKVLTVKGRNNACQHFLSMLSQLLNSLSLWFANDGSGSNLTVDRQTHEKDILCKKLIDLESDLDELVLGLGKKLSAELQDQVYDRFDTAIQDAKAAAVPVVHAWGAPVNRENRALGGLHWSTYAAICRRHGVYNNTRSQFDWNGTLAEPVIKQVVPGWERAFVRRVPDVLNGFIRDGSNLMREFHLTISTRARLNGFAGGRMFLLEEQIKVYEQAFRLIAEQTLDSINNQQRDINREFRPVIEQAMTPVYEQCNNDRGTGVSARRKAYISAHVDACKDVMFDRSTEKVRSLLDDMVKLQRMTVEDHIEDVLAGLKRDYMSAFGWEGGAELLPRHERLMRKDVEKVISLAPSLYQRVCDPNDLMLDDLLLASNGNDNVKEEVDDTRLRAPVKFEDTDLEGVISATNAAAIPASHPNLATGTASAIKHEHHDPTHSSFSVYQDSSSFSSSAGSSPLPDLSDFVPPSHRTPSAATSALKESPDARRNVKTEAPEFIDEKPHKNWKEGMLTGTSMEL